MKNEVRMKIEVVVLKNKVIRALSMLLKLV